MMFTKHLQVLLANMLAVHELRHAIMTLASSN